MDEIRCLRHEELPALLALYRHLHDADLASPGAQVEAAVWAEICANPRISCLGGFVAGELVASCVLTILPNLTRGCRPYALIENVVTHADYRGRGYGQAVLAEAKALAWAAGCYKAMLLTSRRDPAVRRFYEAAGFDAQEKQGFVARPAQAGTL